MFRQKSRAEVAQAEFQEGLAHLGVAVTEAGRAAAEQFLPAVEAAREAAGPRLREVTLQATDAVVPAVTAAVAAAAPAVEAAREAIGPRVGAALDALVPHVEAAREAAAPRLEAVSRALDERVLAAADALTPHVSTAAPKVTAAVTAAQAAATRAAADLGPRLSAARGSAAPALGTAVGALTAGVETARTAAAKQLADVLEDAADARSDLVERAARAAGTVTTGVKRRVGIEPPPAPRRWPWVLAVLAVVGGVAFSVLRRRRTDDPWHPAPAGDGPVPSYREDPVPSSPSSENSGETGGKSVSIAQTMPGDGAPPDNDLGEYPQQMAYGQDLEGTAPDTATTSSNDPALDTATAAPDDQPQIGADATGTEGTNQPGVPRSSSANPQDPA